MTESLKSSWIWTLAYGNQEVCTVHAHTHKNPKTLNMVCLKDLSAFHAYERKTKKKKHTLNGGEQK